MQSRRHWLLFHPGNSLAPGLGLGLGLDGFLFEFHIFKCYIADGKLFVVLVQLGFDWVRLITVDALIGTASQMDSLDVELKKNELQ